MVNKEAKNAQKRHLKHKNLTTIFSANPRRYSAAQSSVVPAPGLLGLRRNVTGRGSVTNLFLLLCLERNIIVQIRQQGSRGELSHPEWKPNRRRQRCRRQERHRRDRLGSTKLPEKFCNTTSGCVFFPGRCYLPICGSGENPSR